jgi:hypothetical protein
MGWWASDDGSGLIGDRPGDVLGALLTDSLGPRFDVELLGGFLRAVGGAVLRDPARLLSDPPRPGDAIAAEFGDRPPLRVAVTVPAVTGGLDDAVFEALETTSFLYREGGPQRPPRWAELLETIAFVARGHVEDATLRCVRPGEVAPPPAWVGVMRGLVGLARTDRSDLRAQAANTAVPADGLRDTDRRALLCLRDVAAGVQRPVHPDGDVAAARAALLADVRAAVAGDALPSSGSPAYVLTALLDPDGVRRAGTVPPEWEPWL